MFIVMRHLTTVLRSEKCVFRRFRRCTNVKECTYTNLDRIAYYTPSLYSDTLANEDNSFRNHIR